MTEFNFHQKKNPLEFPFVTCTPKIFTLTAGVTTYDHLELDLWKYKSRFLICFFTKALDDGSAYSAINRDKFYFPKLLKKIDCRANDISIMNGPIEEIGNRKPHKSKVAFFREQMKYRTIKSSFDEFFAVGCSDQFFVIDLTSLRVDAISQGTKMPQLNFSVEWTFASQETRFLHVYSVTEHFMRLGGKTTDVTYT